jgi:hypothetical protein
MTSTVEASTQTRLHGSLKLSFPPVGWRKCFGVPWCSSSIPCGACTRSKWLPLDRRRKADRHALPGGALEGRLGSHSSGRGASSSFVHVARDQGKEADPCLRHLAWPTCAPKAPSSNSFPAVCRICQGIWKAATEVTCCGGKPRSCIEMSSCGSLRPDLKFRTVSGRSTDGSHSTTAGSSENSRRGSLWFLFPFASRRVYRLSSATILSPLA